MKCPKCSNVNAEGDKFCSTCSCPLVSSPTAAVAAPTEVVVTDVRMPFWSMVMFMVKWAIAAIPALFILVAIVVFIAGVLTGVGKGVGT